MVIETDWYPTTNAGERELFMNVDSKIDGYATKYPFLDHAYLVKIHAFCQTVIEVYDKTVEIRATGKQVTAYFQDLMKNPAKGKTPGDPPSFTNIVLPGNASVGIEAQIRDLARLFKSQGNYDKADGLDLMFEKGESDTKDLTGFSPVLNVTVTQSGAVLIEWRKTGFDSLELQFRHAGDTMWQPADKSTEKAFEFTPQLAQLGTPEKFELRAVCLIKGKRVGEWSTIHTVTLG